MTLYHFDVYTFNDTRQTLTRQGEEVAIRPRTAELLACLLANRGAILSKEELLNRVWADTQVSDAVLFQTMSDVRKTLESSSREPLYIENIKKVGYRWKYEPVREEAEAPLSSSKPKHMTKPRRGLRKRWLFAMAPLMAALFLLGWRFGGNWTKAAGDDPIRLTLLPFADMTGRQEHAWVEFGLLDVVASSLDGIEGVQTQHHLDAMPSVRGDAPTRRELSSLAAALGVDAVVYTRFDKRGENYVLYYTIYGLQPDPMPERVADPDIFRAAQAMGRKIASHIMDDAPEAQREATLSEDRVALRAYGMGVQSMEMGEFGAAETFFERSLHQDPDLLWAKIYLARCKEALGRVDEGERLTREALDQAGAAQNARQIHAAYENLAKISARRGDLDQSVSFREQVLADAEERQDPRAIALAEISLAEAHIQAGQMDQALSVLDRSERLIIELDYPAGMALISYRRASIWSLKGEWEQALKDAGLALGGFREAGNLWWEAKVLSLLGSVREALGEAEAGEQLHEQALKMARQTGNAEALISATNNLGVFYFNQTRFEDALDFYRQAMDEAQRVEDIAKQFAISFNLAEVYLALEQPEKGETYLQKLATRFESMQDGDHVFTVRREDFDQLQQAYRGD